MRERADDAPAPADLVRVVWDQLVDLLGSAAAATLFRRAWKRASASAHPQLTVEILRNGFEYEFRLSDAWLQAEPPTLAGLQLLGAALTTLLRELTGPLVLRRLYEIPALRSHGFFTPEESP